MSKSKPHGTTDEILLLIAIRRKSAWQSMQQIVKGYGPPPSTIPSIALLSNYFMNMVFCIELMLKQLSDDWASHDIPDMYQTAIGSAHGSPQLLQDIRSAIMDQKYLF